MKTKSGRYPVTSVDNVVWLYAEPPARDAREVECPRRTRRAEVAWCALALLGALLTLGTLVNVVVSPRDDDPSVTLVLEDGCRLVVTPGSVTTLERDGVHLIRR